ncbi:hypothetical protein [Sessilibacter corallicola]|uniref:DUF2232 domain-containing protein n=1 Tax=Sessilibacter corallicola TaxID=2904075 RepID=A0ABQ0AD52_9GAMM|nr:hypothetical protein [Sessilibacter corallicola]MCE2027455.1 hypothetical protein [Sessilibacter corallicola]
MRSLAEFIMRGRTQAAIVAVIGIPVISPAAVALFFLRHGAKYSLPVFLATLLPVLTLVIFGFTGVFRGMLGVGYLLTVTLSALMLRWSQSWSLTLVTVVVSSLVAMLITGVMAKAELQVSLASTQEFLESFKTDIAENGGDVSQVDLSIGSYWQILGGLASFTAIASVLTLALARWWQAILYNPGGFKKEFLALVLHPPIAMACTLAMLACYMISDSTAAWAGLFMMPLFISGVALVHWYGNQKGLETPWYVMFYAVLIIIPPLKPFISTVAVLDSFLNLRGRYAPKP